MNEYSDCRGWNLSLRTTLLPKETNPHGTIFGGVILSYIDLAGAVEAKRFCRQMVVTVAMKEVMFKEPVFVGDLVSFYTRMVAIGRSSMTIQVRVLCMRASPKSEQVMVTEADVTYVAVDQNRHAMPIVRRDFDMNPPAFSEDLARELGLESRH